MPASKAEIPGHRGRNPEDVQARQVAFLEAFDEYGTVKHACIKVKIDRTTINRWRRSNLYGFDDLFGNAKEDFAEEIEKTIFQRAMEKDCPPVIQIFVLNGLKPEKYRQQSHITDETAKDVMLELKSKFKGMKFEDTPSNDELSVHKQAENILKGKRNDD